MHAIAPMFALGAVLVAQASPAPTAAPAPVSSPTTPPTTVPTPVPTVVPTPLPTPVYRFVYRPTPSPVTTPASGPNPPEIDEIDLNDSTLAPPSPLHVRVLTSAAVISVSAQTLGRSIPIPQKNTGEFTFDGYIPAVPFFLRNRTFDVQFSAMVTDGRTASITLPLTLR